MSTITIRSMARLLCQLPFGRHPALFFNLGLEGYRNYTFGCRTGPSVSARNVFHELAHAAQFGPDSFRNRATVGGFAFRSSHKVWIAGVPYDEPLTMGATQRELETFAYELRLMQAAGLRPKERTFFNRSARVMSFMPDWYNVPGGDESARARHCAKEIERIYAGLKPKDVLGRMEGWLVCTQLLLARKRDMGADMEQEVPRYNPQQVMEAS
jgi:hypothetical protein